MFIEDKAKFNTHKTQVLDKNKTHEYIASLEMSNRVKDLKLKKQQDKMSQLEQALADLTTRVEALET